LHLLDIQDLHVRYDAAHHVLKGISLGIERTERVAVLGPSGAGKTTLFRAINGFAAATSGSIRVNGVEVKGLKGRELRRLRSRIAVVSQRHDLVDGLAVYQNVMAGALGRWSSWHALRFLLRPAKEELDEAAEALRRVGLEHKLRARSAGISGGEHQRVAIARALVQQPLLLLADEPVASLDPNLAEQILTLLCGLAAESHVTLLCSLHQPQLAERFFDRIIEMRDGRIVDDRKGGSARIDAAEFMREGI
jgi:phosphonate transport system ATP-binding protein